MFIPPSSPIIPGAPGQPEGVGIDALPAEGSAEEGFRFRTCCNRKREVLHPEGEVGRFFLPILPDASGPSGTSGSTHFTRGDPREEGLGSEHHVI